jgi:hypothetical protein
MSAGSDERTISFAFSGWTDGHDGTIDKPSTPDTGNRHFERARSRSSSRVTAPPEERVGNSKAATVETAPRLANVSGLSPHRDADPWESASTRIVALQDCNVFDFFAETDTAARLTESVDFPCPPFRLTTPTTKAILRPSPPRTSGGPLQDCNVPRREPPRPTVATLQRYRDEPDKESYRRDIGGDL